MPICIYIIFTIDLHALCKRYIPTLTRSHKHIGTYIQRNTDTKSLQFTVYSVFYSVSMCRFYTEFAFNWVLPVGDQYIIQSYNHTIIQSYNHTISLLTVFR